MTQYKYLRGSQDSREAVEFDLRSPEDGIPTTCVVNVDLLLCGVHTAPCCDGTDTKLTAQQRYNILKLVEAEREKIITATTPKSNQSWHESGLGSFDEYFRLGDEVTEELVDYFMDLLPPAYMSYGMLQVGEPYSHEQDPDTGKLRATYTTFIKSEGKWKYVGECFYKQEINRVDRKGRLARVLEETAKEVEESCSE